MKTKLCLLASAIALLSACGGEKQANAPAPQTASATQTSTLPSYSVATEFSNPPYIYYDAGNAVGLEHDLLTAIAEKEGFQLKFTPTSWDNMFAQVEKGEVDIIGSNISMTEERKKKYTFTEPYFESATMAIYKKDGIQLPDWRSLGQYKVAVQSGTSQEDAIKKAGLTAESTNTNWLGVKTILADQNDVMVGDKGVMLYYAKQNNLKSSALPTTDKDSIGFIVKQGDAELLKKLNSGLQKIKADGTYDKLYEKWLGEKAVVVAPSADN